MVLDNYQIMRNYKSPTLRGRLIASLLRFRSESTIGGIFEKASGSTTRASKVTWRVLIVGGIIWTLWNFGSTISHYKKFHSFTTLEVEHNRTLEFPALTICNNNPVHCGHLYHQITNCQAENCTNNKLYCDLYFNLKCLWTLSKLGSENYTDSETIYLIEACVYDFDYEDEDCQLLKNQGGQEMFMLTSPPTLCYTFNYHYKDPNLKKPKAVVQALTGLDLTLNLETEYSTLNTYALEQNVAYLAVHHREQVPSGRWTTYSPGFYYDLTLKIKEFQRLPAPYRSECISDWPMDIEGLEKWRPELEGCKWVCALQIMKRDCGCLPLGYLGMVPAYDPSLITDDCEKDPVALSCVSNSSLHLFANLDAHCAQCKPLCNERKYEESVVQTTWPNDNYFDWWLGHNETEQLRMDYQKYLKIHISYRTMVVTTALENPEYTWDQFLNALGGSLSLFLGMSLIAAIEVAELLVHFCDDFARSFQATTPDTYKQRKL